MEFVLVGLLLTALTLAVLQLGLSMYVRNVVHDAAVEGAFHAGLADTSPQEGAQRTRDVISRAVGPGYAEAVVASYAGADLVRVTVVAPLPVAGLWGVPAAMEVTAHAPREFLP